MDYHGISIPHNNMNPNNYTDYLWKSIPHNYRVHRASKTNFHVGIASHPRKHPTLTFWQPSSHTRQTEISFPTFSRACAHDPLTCARRPWHKHAPAQVNTYYYFTLISLRVCAHTTRRGGGGGGMRCKRWHFSVKISFWHLWMKTVVRCYHVNETLSMTVEQGRER